MTLRVLLSSNVNKLDILVPKITVPYNLLHFGAKLCPPRDSLVCSTRTVSLGPKAGRFQILKNHLGFLA